MSDGGVKEVLSDNDVVNLFYAAGNHAMVLHFHALWCEPCRAMVPVMNAIERDNKDIIFARVNNDVCPQASRRFNVTVLPTFIFLINGSEVSRFTGASVESLELRVNELRELMPREMLELNQHRNPDAATPLERQWLSEFVAYADRMHQYHEEIPKMQALSVIPSDRLREIATVEGVVDEVKLVDAMATWFKTEFFEWVDKPKCPNCQTADNVVASKQNLVMPTAEEKAGQAKRVEAYECSVCSAHIRFPRYNDPVKLLETRKGRCGEWANCFALCCVAMGLETRFIVDRSDHVWVEICSRRLGRWVHCDPCEAVVDTPLLYEKGWGKRIDYVLAFGVDEVREVTWRYTFDHKKVLNRRNMVREHALARFIKKLNKRQLNKARPNLLSDEQELELLLRRVREVIELMNPKLQLRDDPQQNQGRISGDIAWTRARGEAGPAAVFTPFEIRPTEDDVTNKVFTVNYSVTGDKYWHGQAEGSSQGFASQAYKVDGVFRKVEADWKQAYLAREKGRATGEIGWRINLQGLQIEEVEIDLKGMAVFESGRVTATACCGDFCVRIPNDTGKAVMKGIGQADHVDILVALEGGDGENAWQHAQLFRSKLDDTEASLKVIVRFK